MQQAFLTKANGLLSDWRMMEVNALILLSMAFTYLDDVKPVTQKKNIFPATDCACNRQNVVLRTCSSY